MQRAVRVDHALGGARRPRGVDDDHAIGGRHVGLHLVEVLVVDRGARGEQRVEAVLARHSGGGTRDEHVAQRGNRRGREPVGSGEVDTDRVHQPIDVVVTAVVVDGHQHVDVGVGEQAAELVAGRERADRYRDRADAGHREPGDDELDAGREQDGDVGAAAGTDRHQTAGDRARSTVGVGVGEPIVVTDQQRRRGPGGDLGPERLADRARHR